LLEKHSAVCLAIAP